MHASSSQQQWQFIVIIWLLKIKLIQAKWMKTLICLLQCKTIMTKRRSSWCEYENGYCLAHPTNMCILSIQTKLDEMFDIIRKIVLRSFTHRSVKECMHFSIVILLILNSSNKTNFCIKITVNYVQARESKLFVGFALHTELYTFLFCLD